MKPHEYHTIYGDGSGCPMPGKVGTSGGESESATEGVVVDVVMWIVGLFVVFKIVRFVFF